MLRHVFITEGLRSGLIDEVPLSGESLEKEDVGTGRRAEACCECFLAHQLVDMVTTSQMKHRLLKLLLNDSMLLWRVLCLRLSYQTKGHKSVL